MGKAFNFYKSCKDMGTLGQQFPDHQKIVALLAKIEKLKGDFKIMDQLHTKLKQV